MKTLLKMIVSAHLILVSSFTFAQIPQTQYSQGISFITGGVGEGEATAMLAEEKQWPVTLELSQIENGRGIWISGASIKVINAKKQLIFDALADGPYMMINLVPGEYVIDAVYQGVAQNKALSVKADSPQKISIFWK